MTGVAYFGVAFLLGVGLPDVRHAGAAASRERSDARKLFFASIIYLPVLLAVMVTDKL